MGLADGIRWRYELYVEPRLLLHESPWRRLVRWRANRKHASYPSPIVYLYADAVNLGDRVSHLGVKSLAGREGVELFVSPPALPGSIRALDALIAAKKAPRLLIGGGGLLQECFNPFWEAVLAREAPFALFGVGANALSGARALPGAAILEGLARKAAFLHVRDSFTENIFAPFAPRRMVRGPCPAIQYLQAREVEAASAGAASGAGAAASAPRKKDLLVHAIHPADLRLNGVDPEAFRVLVRGTARRLGLEYAETDHVHIGLDECLELYRRARAVVTSRLHGAMFSFALGVPFAPVICDVKTAAFVDDYLPGLPKLAPDCKAEDIDAALTVIEPHFSRAREALPQRAAQNAAWMREAMAALGAEG
jgi:hypothetical protein